MVSEPRARVRGVDATAHILRRLCFLDIETTGLDPARDEILEIGVVFVERAVVTARRQWLVRPGRAIPPIITALTGLGDGDVRDAPARQVVGAELAAAIAGWTVVAHNAHFERSFLQAELEGAPVLDSCELALLLYPELPSHSLDALVRWTGVGRAARHRALDDAEDTFLMLAALCERVCAEGRHDDVAALLRHLRPGTSADRAALCALLEALAAGCAWPPLLVPRPPPPSVADTGLVRRLGDWLAAPEAVAAELEGHALLDAALAAAQHHAGRYGTEVGVAVPWARLRTLAATSDWPLLTARQVCRARLARALAQPGADEADQLARAWVESWARRSRLPDPEAASHFLAARYPTLRPLLDAAVGCECGRCAPSVEGTAFLLPHDLALRWLERGATTPMVFLESERLLDHERRRQRRHLDLDSLAGPPALLAELRAALATHSTHWKLSGAARLRVHDALHALRRVPPLAGEPPSAARARRELAPFIDVPPGFELRASPGGLTLECADPGAALARRLGSHQVLLSGVQGGLHWMHRALHGPPPPLLAQVSWHPEPRPLEAVAGEALRRHRRSGAPTQLVTRGPLEPVAAALQRAGARVALEANAADVEVVLLEWRRDLALPEATDCLLHDVREWRRAVLAARAASVTLSATDGLDEHAMRVALAGLLPEATSPAWPRARPSAS